MPIKRTSQEDIDQKLKEADDLKDKKETSEDEEELETPNDDEGKEEEEDKDDENTGDDEGKDDQDEEEEDDQEEEDKDKKPQDKKETPSAEERLKHSTQEAQILFNKQKKFADTVDQASKLPEPTEEELKKEYADWDVMSQTEQRLAKDNLINKRKFDMVHGAVQEGRQLDEWSEKVDTFLVEGVTKYPSLDGKEEKFKRFCMKETRRGVDFDILANAFTNIVGQAKPARKKGSLFSTASGGRPDPKKKDDQFIDEKQAEALRTKDQKTYNRLVREKKIRIEL